MIEMHEGYYYEILPQPSPEGRNLEQELKHWSTLHTHLLRAESSLKGMERMVDEYDMISNWTLR